MNWKQAKNSSRLALTSFAICAAAFFCVPASGQDAPQGPPPTPVRTVAVVEQEIQEHRQVTGDLRAVARSKVATIEQGLVVAFPIEEGDLVKKGDVLARLDDRRIVLELKRITAQAAVAEAVVTMRAAEHERTQRDADTLKELDERRASNPKELADAESDVRVALARKQQAEQDVLALKAEADLLETRLADMAVVAPFDGMIVAKDTEVGQWLGQGDSLAEIVSIGMYDAWLDLPERFAQATQVEGVKIAVEIRAYSQRFAPAAPRIIKEVDETARTFCAVVRVEDKDGRLAPGMSVTGWVPTGKTGKHLLVHRDALMRNEAGFFVYMVSAAPGGHGAPSAPGAPSPPPVAMPVQVDIIFEHDHSVAIRPGPLEVGDQLVTEGNERLYPMMPVAVIGAPPESPVSPAPASSDSHPAEATTPVTAEEGE